MIRQCDWKSKLDDPSDRCQEGATRKIGDFWFCDEHGSYERKSKPIYPCDQNSMTPSEILDNLILSFNSDSESPRQEKDGGTFLTTVRIRYLADLLQSYKELRAALIAVNGSGEHPALDYILPALKSSDQLLKYLVNEKL